MPPKLRTPLRWMLAAATLFLAAPLPAASGAVLGGLTELAGPAGCVTSDGNLGVLTNVCTVAPEVGSVMSLAISPDGRFAYVNGQSSDYNIAILSRDPASGALSPIAGKDFCLSLDGSGNGGADACTDVRLLGHSDEGDSLAMPRDGSFLYVGGVNGIAVFRRDAATGKLTQLDGKDGCLSPDGMSEDGADTCTDARRLSNVHTITLSRDERFAYVNAQEGSAGAGSGIAIFSRDATTGKLTQLGGTDGCATYNGSSEDGAGTCQDIRGGGYANAFAITRDDKHAYLPHYDQDSIALLDVDPATGKVSQPGGTAGCLSANGASEDGPATCQDVGVLGGAWSAVISLDGKTLYVSNFDERGLAVFRIDATSGALTPLAGTDHCITNDGDSSEGAATCADGRGFDESEVLTASSDGRSLYMANRATGVVVMSLDPATGKATELDGKDGCFTFDGSSADGPDTCTDIRATSGTHRLALSPDQAFGYIGGNAGLTAFSRQASPVCTDVAGATPFATPFAFTLTCSDPNGDPFTRQILTTAGHGALSSVDPSLAQVTYTPAAGFSGADSFSFRAVDASSAGAPATAAVTVGAAPPPTPDRVAPVCARSSARRLSLARLTISVRCGEAARLAARLTLPRRVARRLRIAAARRVTIATGRAQAAANATTKLKLKLTRKARKRLRNLSSARLRRLRPTLRITATDLALNTSTRTARVRLKR